MHQYMLKCYNVVIMMSLLILILIIIVIIIIILSPLPFLKDELNASIQDTHIFKEREIGKLITFN